MIGFKVSIPDSLGAFIHATAAGGRRLLYSAAANAVRVLVRSHLARESTIRHFTASRLGADPTGHLEKGARATTFRATDSYGEVVIPIPGINRAFHDVTITPTHASALTIPLDAVSYGRRASEMTAIGWHLFRPKGKDVIMGTLEDEEPICLYLLRKKVVQRQDRSLLPSDSEIQTTAARAIMAEIYRVAKIGRAA